jgi:tellurite resistance protein TerC
MPLALFTAAVLLLVALDLGVWHRRPRVIGAREALLWTAGWVVLALMFAAGLALTRGGPDAIAYLTAYAIECSLSLDNVLVISLIFASFGIPAALQHRVLFWGILGALAMRGAFILAGVALLQRIPAFEYVLAVALLIGAFRMLRSHGEHQPPTDNIVLRALSRVIPVRQELDGDRFVTRATPPATGWVATPLLVALVAVELADLAFAFDSIPASFAVTRDPFLIFTANMFAVLGLRSLYFLLAAAIRRFRYLSAALATVLALVGVELLVQHVWPIPTGVTLAAVVIVLAVGAIASL